MESDTKYPTYGELIDMLDDVEEGDGANASHLLARFRESYSESDIYIGRPGRFLETVERISKPSLRGEPKLTGSLLASYRKRIWKPRLRNCSEGSYNQYFCA